MKKLLLSAITCLLMTSVNAQTAATTSTIYLEAFEGSSTTLPTGWVSTPTTSAWVAASTNNSTGYTGASGGNSIKIINADAATGSYSISSKPVSTVGYTNITVSWGARFTTNFGPSNITPLVYYSTNNGSTWSSVSYTEASSGSNWKLNGPISFPAAVENQPSVIFQLVANITHTASGTYSIDDFLVKGAAATTATTSIKTTAADASLESFVYNKVLSFKSINQNTSVNAVKVYEITGKEVMNKAFEGEKENTVSLSDLTTGIYMVKFELNNGQSFTKKIALF